MILWKISIIKMSKWLQEQHHHLSTKNFKVKKILEHSEITFFEQLFPDGVYANQKTIINLVVKPFYIIIANYWEKSSNCMYTSEKSLS